MSSLSLSSKLLGAQQVVNHQFISLEIPIQPQYLYTRGSRLHARPRTPPAFLSTAAMPFNFKKYDAKCAGLDAEQLQREWQHYTRLITGAATSTAVSGGALLYTGGISAIGIAIASPMIHNARKKREIIERHLRKLDTAPETRKRDVLGGAAVSGTIGVVTLGIGTFGTEALVIQGAELGISAFADNQVATKAVAHTVLDIAGVAAEHAHTDHLQKQDAKRAAEAAKDARVI